MEKSTEKEILFSVSFRSFFQEGTTMNRTEIPLRKQVDVLGGFWGERQRLNRAVTIHSVYDRFSDTGRFEAFRHNWQEGMPNRPHIFWDSDVAKWLESAAYIIEKTHDPVLEKQVDDVVDLIEEHQWNDGYFNIYYTLFEPGNRFTERMDHELYCAGHLTEAAVAYYYATGKDKFLRLMCRYADLIEKAFVTEKWAKFSTPGHEEIELALIKLWKATGEKRYLLLSKHFIDARGKCEDDLFPEERQLVNGVRDHSAYVQSHKPVREQTEAVGHCVRAVYLYCGMADVAAATNDEELFAAADRLFDSIASRKMYITGGIGQTCVGEAFAADYDLPDTSSYCETCAAIGLILLAWRLSAAEPNRKYDDVAERALYNGFLCGVSLDGKSFFYDNANEIDLIGKNQPTENRHRPFYPLIRRVEVFSCSCCPPNVTRMTEQIGELAYSSSGDTVWVHHFVSSRLELNGRGLTAETDYPKTGSVRFTVKGDYTLALRLPGWCESFTLNRTAEKKADGYLYLPVHDGDVIEYNMEMPVRFTQANPRVRQHANRIAVEKGPLVFCAEGADNPLPLRGLMIDLNGNAEITFDETLGTEKIVLDGFVRPAGEALYAPFSRKKVKQKIQLIPYYAYANRDECDMLIWLSCGEE